MATQQVSARELKQAIGGSQRQHERLMQAGLTLLAHLGLPARPIHTGPRVTPDGMGGWRLRSNKAQHGVGDVITCLPPDGQLVWIEFKTGKAQRSREQIELHDAFKRAGAICLVIRDIATMHGQVLALKRESVERAARAAVRRPRGPSLDPARGP